MLTIQKRPTIDTVSKVQYPPEEYSETFTGRIIHVPDLEPDDIDIRDIAHALSQVPRHMGHCLAFLSVAQHCVQVHDWLWQHGECPREGCLHGLLHDAEEAYIGDMGRPIKYRPEMQPFVDMSRKLQKRIFGKYRVDTSWESEVKRADDVLVSAEIHQYKRSRGKYTHRKPVPHTQWEPFLELWPMEKAEKSFLETFHGHRSGVY